MGWCLPLDRLACHRQCYWLNQSSDAIVILLSQPHPVCIICCHDLPVCRLPSELLLISWCWWFILRATPSGYPPLSPSVSSSALICEGELLSHCGDEDGVLPKYTSLPPGCIFPVLLFGFRLSRSSLSTALSPPILLRLKIIATPVMKIVFDLISVDPLVY